MLVLLRKEILDKKRQGNYFSGGGGGGPGCRLWGVTGRRPWMYFATSSGNCILLRFILHVKHDYKSS